MGTGGDWDAGYYWIGWDYAHAGDAFFFDYPITGIAEQHTWTVPEVLAELREAIKEFKSLMS
jgi:hypothetical protein